ncbi:putative UDP-glucuronosyltransferase 2C1 [Apostichopus japonicus]|uniref:Putative UDP-glucuronosyltransferase 2C1 n=1 Tax=Stichopus japonicus TaxID=307972 RepID=A0A2G8JNF4_STIJA|nr:putative UDP-glucuronosyltransferase 2C1 [Apostichopus japonicus]
MARRTLNAMLVVSCFIIWIAPCSGGNILLVSTNSLSSPSHYMVLSTLTGGLVANGHNVTLVTNDLKGTHGFPNGTYSQTLTFKASYLKEDQEKLENTMKEFAFVSPGFTKTFKFFGLVMDALYNSCLDLWKDQNLLNELQNSHFDFALVFPFSSCDVLVAHYVNAPFAIVFPSIRAPTFHEGYVGMPYPSSYVPFDVFGTLTDEMTFLQRLQNLMSPLLYHIMQYISNLSYHSIQVTFDILPDKSIKELYSQASLVLSHVSMGSDYPRPYTPNFIPIGGLISGPSKPLSKELEDFVQGSGDHGIIIFTLGSAVQGLSNKDTAEIFARVFKKLPQRILWRHNAEPPASLANNTRLLKWLPQNDLLAHPKTRLLIYHGGSNGVLESITHGIPMVVIPLLGDQVSHGARVQKKGMGLMLDKTNITEENLMEVVQEVLHNPSYKERAQLFSDIHNDLPMKPLERAVYWIEHVMKFGGAHLRPRSADMNFIELYMIDVAVFLIIVSAIGIYVEYLILSKLFRMCCSGKYQNPSLTKM